MPFGLSSIFSYWFGGSNRGYDGTQTSNRRQSRMLLTGATDSMLGQHGRDWGNSEVRDLQRNFSLAAWAVRRHLDYVTGLSLHTDSDRLRELMSTWSQPLNCDVQGRRSLREIVRECEQRRLVDGDVLPVKLGNGMLQLIEADRIRDPAPNDTRGGTWVNGVRTSKSGRHQAYSIYGRYTGSDYVYERTVPARNTFYLGYFDRTDQVRGVSPLLSAANQFRDLYEGHDYQLAKSKVLAAMGLVVTTPRPESYGTPTSTQQTSESENQDYYDDFIESKAFGKPPWFLMAHPGDKVEMLTADTPGGGWLEFTRHMTRLCLNALDIPFEAWDGQGYNFSQMKAGHLAYAASCRERQKGLIWLLDSITKWKVATWVMEGLLPASEANVEWEWVPEGVSWWNPVDEVAAAISEIEAGLNTRTHYCLAVHGKRFEDVAAKLAEEQNLLRSLGLGSDDSTSD